MNEVIRNWASELKRLAIEGGLDSRDGVCTQVYKIAEEMDKAALGQEAATWTPGNLSLSIIHKLAQEYFRIFYVDIRTGDYSSYDPYSDDETFDLSNTIQDFFLTTDQAMFDTLYPDDRESFFTDFKMEKFADSVRRTGEYTIVYRVLDKGKPVFVSMVATQLENDPDHIIVGVKNIDTQVRREKELASRLKAAESEANTDALTGVKNKHAIIDYEAELKHRIEEKQLKEFAVIVFDVNGLKKVNDEQGHHAGDQLIRDACSIICNTFKHSPVFRIGGDEFTVIASGHDYDHIDEKMGQIADINNKNLANGSVVIAAGMARYMAGDTMAAVFERADAKMYENKKRLKSGATM